MNQFGRIGVGMQSPNAALHVDAPSADATVLQEVARFSSSGRSSIGGTANRGTLISFYDANNGTIVGAVGGLRANPGATVMGASGSTLGTDSVLLRMMLIVYLSV